MIIQYNESSFTSCYYFHLYLYNVDSLNGLMNISSIYFYGSQNVAKALRSLIMERTQLLLSFLHQLGKSIINIWVSPQEFKFNLLSFLTQLEVIGNSKILERPWWKIYPLEIIKFSHSLQTCLPTISVWHPGRWRKQSVVNLKQLFFTQVDKIYRISLAPNIENKCQCAWFLHL